MHTHVHKHKPIHTYIHCTLCTTSYMQTFKHMHTQTHAQRFLALVITMGVVNYPPLHHYAWPFHTSTFSSIMSRDRFLLLLKFLHLANNTEQVPRGQPGHDRLYKLRAFSSAMICRFKACYRTHREISIDESMFGFKDRLSFHQYMPKKPTKWGMKAWVWQTQEQGTPGIGIGTQEEKMVPVLTHWPRMFSSLSVTYHCLSTMYTSTIFTHLLVELNTKNQ